MASRPPVPAAQSNVSTLRREAVSRVAQSAGYLDGKTSRVQARIAETLLAAAKERSGIASDTALLEYALARVAIEDDFGPQLLALKGSVPADIDLEF